jgi:hypothetical protein
VKEIFGFCVALSCASALSPSVVAAETLPPTKLHGARAPHHLVHDSVVPLAAGQAPNAAVPPFSWITQLFPSVKPYPPGQGGADGLSRNVDDCNKGCIDIPIR